MERKCKNCRGPIPETMRIDAVFCSPRCGWRYRNNINRDKRLEAIKSVIPDPLEKNYRIIHFLFQDNRTVLSRSTLKEIGFDPEIYSGMKNLDCENNKTEFMIREYVLTLDNYDLITINKY